MVIAQALFLTPPRPLERQTRFESFCECRNKRFLLWFLSAPMINHAGKLLVNEVVILSSIRPFKSECEGHGQWCKFSQREADGFHW